MGLPTHNFQEPQVKFRSPNLFFQFDLHHQEKAAGVSGHNIGNVEVDFYMLHSVIYLSVLSGYSPMSVPPPKRGKFIFDHTELFVYKFYINRKEIFFPVAE